MTNEIKVILGIIFATIIILVGGVFIAGRNNTSSGLTGGKVDANILVRDDSYKTATDSAVVTLVEFGDFQCPACGEANPFIKTIINDYKEKVNFVPRNFPLPQHTNAPIAAEAAEAAGLQGKYWEMYDKLYDKQDEWSESNKPLDIFMGYAKELGLNTEEFKQSVEKNQFANKIQRDLDDGNTIGIDATPTFYLNSEKFNGSLSELRTQIDKALSSPTK